MRLVAAALFLLAIPSIATAQDDLPIPHYAITLEAPVRGSIGARIGALFEQLRARTVGVLRPKPGTKYRVTAVAFSPTISQNYGDPCRTASGTTVQPGTIASNIFPIGTQLNITTTTGEKMAGVVLDRMNARYNGVPIIDVWHPTREQALTFGKRIAVVEVRGYIPRSEITKYFSLQPTLAPEPAPAPKPKPTPVPQEEEPTEARSIFQRTATALVQVLLARVSVFRDVPCAIPIPPPQ